MNIFYEKLTKFGSLVYTSSRTKQMDMAHYFTVVHPAYPVVKHPEEVRPGLQFSRGCPKAVKAEVCNLWRIVFGSD